MKAYIYLKQGQYFVVYARTRNIATWAMNVCRYTKAILMHVYQDDTHIMGMPDNTINVDANSMLRSAYKELKANGGNIDTLPKP